MLLQTVQPVVPMSGFESWFSLVLQGGSFAVLVYLFLVGLPKMRKEVADEHRKDLDEYRVDLAEFRKTEREQRETFTTAIGSVVQGHKDDSVLITSTFKGEMVAERIACDRHIATLADAVKSGNDSTMKAMSANMEAVKAMLAQGSRHHEANREQQRGQRAAEAEE